MNLENKLQEEQINKIGFASDLHVKRGFCMMVRTIWKIESSNHWWLENEVEAIEPNANKTTKWEENIKESKR